MNLVRQAFVTYNTHLKLLLVASFLSSVGWLINPLFNPAHYVKVDEASVAELFDSSSNPQEFAARVAELARSTRVLEKGAAPASRALNFCLYMLSVFLRLGLIAICLDLVAKGSSNLSRLIEQGAAFFTNIKVMLLLVCSGVAVLLPLMFIGQLVPVVGAAVFGLFVLFVIVGAFLCLPFYQWYLVDRTVTARQSLLSSFNLIKNNLFPVIGYLLFLIFITMIARFGLDMMFTTLFGFLLPHHAVARFALGDFVAGVFVVPFGYVMMTHLYRQYG